jgi:hypothetical protein
MATTTNYSWTTPDDTDLVKDGASAIRSLGTAIDSTVFTNAGNAINKSIVDAAGDLIYGTADNTVARLALGTAGQVLKVNSGATAPEWGSASGGKSFTLLNAGGTALTGATTITVSGLTGDDIYVVIDSASSALTSSSIDIRLNSDSASKYSLAGYGDLNLTTRTLINDGAPDSQTSYRLASLSSQAASEMSGWLQIRGASTSGIKLITSVASGNPGGAGTGYRAQNTQGTYTGTSAITSISIISSNGNFDNGTIYVYGAN